MRVAGKTLVVTGAGDGIGRAVVLEAVRRGARVAAVGPDAAAVRETARQAVAPLLVSAHEVDVTDHAAAETLPATVAERWGAVDGLIHCAGAVQRFSPDDEALRVSRGFLRLLRTRPEAHLVTVPGPGGASRAVVKVLADGLRAACAGTNIRITVVAGQIAAGSAPAAVGQAAYRAARDILDAVERNASRVTIGPDAGLIDRLRWHPRTRPA
ncbi:SDR family NAD(P)-dependent oxidoreductase [Actinoplanes teichomyceticus]|nr:SDR family oxidoreductase [Actinoplanes teichomyceticus]